MSLMAMRPTFRLQVSGELSAVQQRLHDVLKRPAWKDRGQIFGDYAEFHVPESEQRYWSPHLAIHLEPLNQEQQIQYRHTDGAELASVEGTDPARSAAANDAAAEVAAALTLLVGRFAPRQNVWMLVWIVYLAMGFIVFFALVYGGVQYWMNATPWALSVGLGAVACILSLHLVSMIGQGLSSDQMHELRERFDDLLRETGLEPSESK
ncbi:MAG: hypothetical protein Q8M16_10790 [Pirellulaceae bacterium]|nr:hypothetical protein [Pirellulaceae bacterium]